MSRGIVRDKIEEMLHQALLQARKRGELKVDPLPPITLDAPKRPEWGDLASTVAMVLAAREQRAPHEIARIIVSNMAERERWLDRVEIMQPGFLNMTVKREVWLEVLREIERQGARYGTNKLAQGQRLLIEFVSANPTGPLHVGHGRGAAVGQVLGNLFEAAGAEVVREYYINDAGRQMRLLGASVLARYEQLNGRESPVPEDGYQGQYIEDVAALVLAQAGTTLLQLPREEAERRCLLLAYEHLVDEIRADLARFGVTFQSWFSEASLQQSGAVLRVIQELKSRGLIVEQDGAVWFRSSAYGDEKDRVVQKQDGDFTYLASDIAYHRDKLLRGYDRLINVWGADHHGYIPRMQAVVEAFGYPRTHLGVVLVQMVSLLRGGKKVEMSKRAGEFITLREVIDEVGADAAKFSFLMRRSDTHLDFDLELVKQQSADNPVYYVQYAHARVASLCRVAESRGIMVPNPSQADLSALTNSDEFALIRKLSIYPTIVEGAVTAMEPHRVAVYLQELASQLHAFYFRHRILPPVADAESEPETMPRPLDARAGTTGTEAAALSSCHRETLTPELTGARLALMRQIRQVIHNGLGLLGVSAPERM